MRWQVSDGKSIQIWKDKWILTVNDIFCVIGKSFDKTYFTYNWVDLGCI